MILLYWIRLYLAVLFAFRFSLLWTRWVHSFLFTVLWYFLYLAATYEIQPIFFSSFHESCYNHLFQQCPDSVLSALIGFRSVLTVPWKNHAGADWTVISALYYPPPQGDYMGVCCRQSGTPRQHPRNKSLFDKNTSNVNSKRFLHLYLSGYAVQCPCKRLNVPVWRFFGGCRLILPTKQMPLYRRCECL